jgi:predicted TIM-barrel fold metal-dependent hydrolase
VLTVDADAHVVESERTWDFMLPEDQRYRPIIVTPRGQPEREYWLIDGKLRGAARVGVLIKDLKELSRVTGRQMDAPLEARELSDVPVRLRHMDELGIDVQVLYPTIFIQSVTDRAAVDVAVCRGYNRWLGDVWAQGNGRLRWLCAPPLLSIPDALDELRWSKEHGAVGIFFRPVEGSRLLQDPYFDPIYEEASRLNLAIGVHIANANEQMLEVLSQHSNSGFWTFRLAAVGAFHSLIMSGLPERFPGLRFVFAEAAAQWIPYAIKDLRRRWPDRRGGKLSDTILQDYRIYVSCQTDDDLPYVIQYAGEDNLVIGTDYGHNDQSTEIEVLRNLETDGQIDSRQYAKITSTNPRALYSL